MTIVLDKDRARTSFLMLAKRLTLSQRIELTSDVEFLEDYFELPHELCLDQRKVVAGSSMSVHQLRRLTRREYSIEGRATGHLGYFTIVEAAVVMGVAESSLASLTSAKRSFDKTRENPNLGPGDDILTCERLPKGTTWSQVPELDEQTRRWVDRKARRREYYRATPERRLELSREWEKLGLGLMNSGTKAAI